MNSSIEFILIKHLQMTRAMWLLLDVTLMYKGQYNYALGFSF